MRSYNDMDLMAVSFYGMSPPDPKYMRDRMKKVTTVIASMGNKYLLATPVERKAEPLRK